MAIQLKIRRGTAVQNDAFTGAEAELTYDTTSKGLRIHDGTTQGGYKVPVLVEVQRPALSNNYTWARRYSDGWVEQGGFIDGGTTGWETATITFPFEMSDTNYQLFCLGNWSDAQSSSCQVTAKTTTGATIRHANNTTTIQKTVWYACGIGA